MAAASARQGGDPKELYSTLGVSTDVNEADLRKAYRRLALRWHPDKNQDDPSATEAFQKISAAYEVLSDPQRREMYDSTGCVDAEELEEADLGHAQDLFAAFFGGFGGFGGGAEDLDEDEQAMLDEFLRAAGGAAFRRGGGRRGRRKKGRGSRRGGGGTAGSAAAADAEARLFAEMMAGMAGMVGGADEPELVVRCAAGHPLKRKKADAEYACDECGKDISTGKRFYDCRKCDYCMCLKCHKAAEERMAMEAGGLDDEDAEQLIDAFLEAVVQPVREGGRLLFRCGICNRSMRSEEAACKHAVEQHEEELHQFLEAQMDDLGGMPGMMAGMMPGAGGVPGMPTADDLAAMFAGMDGLLGGGGGSSGAAGSSSRGGGRKPRKKR